MSSTRRRFLTSTVSGGAALAALSSRSLLGSNTHPGGSAWPRHPKLEGNFFPVFDECTINDLPVIGEIPAGLNGTLNAVGPNPQFPPYGPYHWFDGDGMVHAVTLSRNGAQYSNRWVRTAAFEEERAAGHALYSGLAADPARFPALGRLKQKNAANTAFVQHAGKLLALYEAGSPIELALPGPGTVGDYTFNGQWRNPVTAHPRKDPKTGDLVFYCYEPSSDAPKVHYAIADSNGNLSHYAALPLPQPVMMHSFAITEDYTVFIDYPAVFTPERLQFKPEYGARLMVLPRRGDASSVRVFPIEVGFAYHSLSAYQEGNTIVLRVCRADRFVNSGAPQSGPRVEEVASYLHSYIIDLVGGTVRELQLDDRGIEFPQFNPAYECQKLRYAYATVDRKPTYGGLVKYDLERGTSAVHDCGRGRFTAEGIFVAAANAQSEDDGFVLSYVYDAPLNRSELMILDAKDFSRPPLARVMLPRRVPFTFHGTFVPMV